VQALAVAISLIFAAPSGAGSPRLEVRAEGNDDVFLYRIVESRGFAYPYHNGYAVVCKAPCRVLVKRGGEGLFFGGPNLTASTVFSIDPGSRENTFSVMPRQKRRRAAGIATTAVGTGMLATGIMLGIALGASGGPVRAWGGEPKQERGVLGATLGLSIGGVAMLVTGIALLMHSRTTFTHDRDGRSP